MPAPYPMGETVTILRSVAVSTDSHGNDVPGDDGRVPVRGCAVWHRTSAEDTGGRDQVTVGLGVVLPYGTDVRATDRLLVRGVVYEVDGQPAPLKSPLTGSRMGVEVSLTEVTG